MVLAGVVLAAAVGVGGFFLVRALGSSSDGVTTTVAAGPATTAQPATTLPSTTQAPATSSAPGTTTTSATEAPVTTAVPRSALPPGIRDTFGTDTMVTVYDPIDTVSARWESTGPVVWAASEAEVQTGGYLELTDPLPRDAFAVLHVTLDDPGASCEIEVQTPDFGSASFRRWGVYLSPADGFSENVWDGGVNVSEPDQLAEVVVGQDYWVVLGSEVQPSADIVVLRLLGSGASADVMDLVYPTKAWGPTDWRLVVQCFQGDLYLTDYFLIEPTS